MHQPQTNISCVAYKAAHLTHIFAWAAPPPPPPPASVQLPLPVDPVDRRCWEDYRFDEDVPGYPTSGDDIDIVLAVLLKGLSGIDAKELDGLLKDLLMPEPGAKGEISVKEAAEICFICYIVCEIWCYIACYLPYHILVLKCRGIYKVFSMLES